MKRPAVDGRMFAPHMTAKLVTRDDGPALLAPAVGLWRDAPMPGARVEPGGLVGTLEVLGVQHRVFAPKGARGIVRGSTEPRVARRPVAFGDVLVSVDPNVAGAAIAADEAQDAIADSATGLAFVAPLSGRYYAKPGPDQDHFVSVGDIVSVGQTIALLEVMKTFNRVTYGGDGLPERARITAIVPSDGDDVDEGDVLVRLEPA